MNYKNIKLNNCNLYLIQMDKFKTIDTKLLRNLGFKQVFFFGLIVQGKTPKTLAFSFLFFFYSHSITAAFKKYTWELQSEKDYNFGEY